MRILIATFLFVLAVLNPASAQVLWRAADHVTPSGLAFRYVQLPRGQTQSIQFGWKDGWAAQRANGKGIAVFGPALVMQGPKGSNRAEFVEDVKDTQGQMYIASTPEYTIGGVFAPPQKFPAALKLFAKTLSNPAMDPARLEDLRKVHLAAITQAERQPLMLANRVGAHLQWEDSPILGWTKDDPFHFTGTSLAEIEDWRRAVLTRKGLVIAAAGPATAEQAALHIDELFVDLPPTGNELPAPVFPRKPAKDAVLIEADVPQTVILMGGWSSFDRGLDQTIALVAARALQQRLHRELREKLGATYAAAAQVVPLIAEPLIFSLHSMVAHDRAIEALATMRKEHQKFLADGLSENELDSERQRLRTEFNEGIRRPPAVANLLRGALFEGHPPDFIETFPDRLAALTLVEVNAGLKKGLAGNSVGTVIVAPKGDGFSGFCVIKAVEAVKTCPNTR